MQPLDRDEEADAAQKRVPSASWSVNGWGHDAQESAVGVVLAVCRPAVVISPVPNYAILRPKSFHFPR
jgi:hypothetical protein